PATRGAARDDGARVPRGPPPRRRRRLRRRAAMISAPRRAGYEVTLRVDTGRSDLARALADLRDVLESARDRALATDIATGTQRWRGQLDYLLAAASGRRLTRLDPEVLAILRMSPYQLRHLTRVPPSAVVNDA